MRGLMRLLSLAAITVGCLDVSWKEGIACDSAGRCPGSMRCCDGACRKSCPATDAGAADGPPRVVVCPEEAGGCYACMPGCACTCAGASGICCELFGVASCAGCP